MLHKFRSEATEGAQGDSPPLKVVNERISANPVGRSEGLRPGGAGYIRGKPLIRQSGGYAATIPVEASNEKCWPKPASFVASTGIEHVFKV